MCFSQEIARCSLPHSFLSVVMTSFDSMGGTSSRSAHDTRPKVDNRRTISPTKGPAEDLLGAARHTSWGSDGTSLRTQTESVQTTPSSVNNPLDFENQSYKYQVPNQVEKNSIAYF